MSEQLTQLCGCAACRAVLPEKVEYGSADQPFCSAMCKRHAGGQIEVAKRDHREMER